MPCLYAHHVFGQKVREQLPENMKKCIAKYEDCYQWGLQGPDFLFYCNVPTGNKIKKAGRNLHKQSFGNFLQGVLQQTRQKGVQSPQMAYLLGFLCHFMLDSQCHPYVNAWKGEGFPHADTEKAFDQYLIKLDGGIPGTYKTYELLPLHKRTIKTICSMYTNISRFHIYSSCLLFVMAKRFFYAKGEKKRRRLISWTKRFHVYEKWNRHFYWERMQKKFDKKSARLTAMLEEIVEETVVWEKGIWNGVESNDKIELPKRLEHTDFGGLFVEEG